MSVTESLCLSQTVSVCHMESVSATDNFCLSQAVCVCHRHSSCSFLAWSYLIYTLLSLRFVREILICPSFKYHRYQLCGTLGGFTDEERFFFVLFFDIIIKCWNSVDGEGGGSDNVDKYFCLCFIPFKGQFWLFNAYLVVSGLIFPKTKETNLKYL